MFKNSPSICYIFFAIYDVIMTSVNDVNTSMMGISTEDWSKIDNTGTVVWHIG